MKVTGVDPHPLRIFMTGGAGTGKSLVIKTLYYVANKIFTPICENADDITDLLLAYTGTAAFNIGGRTIHSAFAIHSSTNIKTGKYTPLKEEQVTKLRYQYRNLLLIIIDEVSIVGKKMLTFISERLCQIKRISTSFGGVSILAIGHFFQIPRVGDGALYKDDPSALCVSPWTEFQKFELTQIMRQKDDLSYAEALNTMRTKLRTESLSVEIQQLLLNRVLNPPDDVLHIYARNAEVDQFNAKMLSQMPGIVTIEAVDEERSTSRLSQARKAPVKRARSVLPIHLTLAEEARVMLISNVDVADGLCNGVLGTVSRIINGSKPLGQPQYIFILFDNKNLGTNARILHPPPPTIDSHAVAIVAHTEQIQFGEVRITRHQYPLKLAWACTVHKTQGMTLQKCSVSLKHTFLPGLAYVALSRVTSAIGLYLEDLDEHLIYCDAKLQDALQSMPIVELGSVKLYKQGHLIIVHNILSLGAHLDDIKSNHQIIAADVLAFTETWLDSSTSNEQIQIPGFKWV